MSKPRNILLHAHIFKNAGTTFDFTLRRNFGDAFVDHREDQKILEGKQEYLEEFLTENPKVEAFSSHSIHFIPNNNERFRYFTVYFLRHPIERMRSVYDFEKKQGTQNMGAQKAKELSFSGYLEWRMRDDVPATIRNCQTIFMSGLGPSADKMEEKFKVASAHLEQSLAGITHHYDESMVILEKKLKPHFPQMDLSYVRRNITDQNIDEPLEKKIAKVEARTENEDLFNLVLEKNKLDIELFQQGLEQLHRDIEKYEGFELALAEFKNRNQSLPKKRRKPSKFKKTLLKEKSSFAFLQVKGFGPPPLDTADRNAHEIAIYEAVNATAHLTGMNQLYRDESGQFFGPKSDLDPGLIQAPLRHLPGTTLSVVTPGGSSFYFHWMVDLIPKLFLIREKYGSFDSFDRILVNEHKHRFQKASLRFLGVPDEKVKRLPANRNFKFDKVVTCVFSGTPRIDEVIRIWNNLAPWPQKNHKPKRKIYISREDANGRNVVNESEFWPSLKRLGFERVTLADMNIRQQIKLFQSSAFIISPHGGSLTNLLWCHPGTKVIELFSAHFMPAYVRIAQAKKLDYHYFQCETIDTPSTKKEVNQASISVPGPELVHFVKNLL